MTPSRQPTTESADELMLKVVDLLPKVFFKLKAFGDHVWSPLELTTTERGLMGDLRNDNRLTAPQLAAKRPVSRQAVQPVLDSLTRRGLLETYTNPRKARSPLYALSPKGEALLLKGLKREMSVLAAMELNFRAADVRSTLEVLTKMEAVLADMLETKT